MRAGLHSTPSPTQVVHGRSQRRSKIAPKRIAVMLTCYILPPRFIKIIKTLATFSLLTCSPRVCDSFTTLQSQVVPAISWLRSTGMVGTLMVSCRSWSIIRSSWHCCASVVGRRARWHRGRFWGERLEKPHLSCRCCQGNGWKGSKRKYGVRSVGEQASEGELPTADAKCTSNKPSTRRGGVRSRLRFSWWRLTSCLISLDDRVFPHELIDVQWILRLDAQYNVRVVLSVLKKHLLWRCFS